MSWKDTDVVCLDLHGCIHNGKQSKSFLQVVYYKDAIEILKSSRDYNGNAIIYPLPKPPHNSLSILQDDELEFYCNYGQRCDYVMRNL